MHLIRTNDFEIVKSKYIDVIDHTPDIKQHVHWVYGKHPSDELLKSYIEKGEMYCLMDGHEIAGMTAITMYQGEDYECISWQEDLPSDQVAVIHLLAICPAYRGKALGMVILDEAMELALRKGKKALRLDVLKDNLPAWKMYERANFSYRGMQRLYAENTGMLDFMYYEKILSQIEKGERS